jgi:CheY-like chemotaxis protein
MDVKPQNATPESLGGGRTTTSTDSGHRLGDLLAGAAGNLQRAEAELLGGAAIAEPRRAELAALVADARRGCERALAMLAAVRAPAAPPPRRARVLIIDDEPAVGRTLARTLRGHDVEALLRAEEALQKIAAGEEFDLILCDLMMPEMGGVELHEAVAAIAPAIAERIVFMTGGVYTERVDTFLRSVPNRRVGKPFRVDEVRAICDEALALHAAK